MNNKMEKKLKYEFNNYLFVKYIFINDFKSYFLFFLVLSL